MKNRRQRKEWKKIVDKVIDKDKGREPKIVIDARKKLFMALFDDYMKKQKEDSYESKRRADHIEP